MSTAAFKVDQVPSWLCVRRERACAVVHSVSWSVLTAHILCRSLSFLLLSYISPISESSNFLNISDNFEPFLTFLLKFVLLGVGSCRAFITWRKEKNIYNCEADWYKTQHIIGLTIREYWPRVHWHSKHSINSKSKFRRWEDLLLSYNSWVLAAGRACEQCSTSCAGQLLGSGADFALHATHILCRCLTNTAIICRLLLKYMTNSRGPGGGTLITTQV